MIKPGNWRLRMPCSFPKGSTRARMHSPPKWRERYGSNDAAIVQAALSLFHDGGFRYTLAPAPLGRDAMDDFLFDTHEGFCEHYSSAFTVLMRDAGIPARVVTGYQGGFWNALGQLSTGAQLRRACMERSVAGRARLGARGSHRRRCGHSGSILARLALPVASNRGIESGELESLLCRIAGTSSTEWWDQGVIGFDALRQRGLLTPFGIRDADTRHAGRAAGDRQRAVHRGRSGVGVAPASSAG